MVRFAWLVLPVLLAGCLPDRSNPFDPANAPHAQLRILEMPRSSGVCPDAVILSSAFEVEVASRGACLFLDASSTSDPHLEISELTLSYARIDVDPAEPLDGAASIIDIDTSRVREWPVGELLTLQVTAMDTRDGGIGQAEARLLLTNARPAAVAGPARVLPIGGMPWAPSDAITIAFDATASADPDGDPLEYCWQFPPDGITATPDALCTDQAIVERTLPVGQQAHHISRLVVDDGVEASLPTVSVVDVSDTLWAHYLVDNEVMRLDSRRAYFGGGQLASQVNAFERTDGTSFLVSTYVATSGLENRLSIVFSTWPDPDAFTGGASGPIQSYAFGSVESRWDPAANRIWSLASSVSSLDAVAYDLVPGGITVTTVASGFVSDTGSSGLKASVAADGTMWAALEKGEVAWRFTASGTTVTGDGSILAQAGWGWREVQARPVPPDVPPGQNAEVWLIQEKLTGLAESARLVAFDAETGAIADSWPTGFDQVSHFSWINESELWMSVPGEGLFLVDATRLYLGFDEAIEVEVPGIFGVRALHVDVATGGCWVVTGLDVSFVDRDGTAVQRAGYTELLSSDQAGQLWWRQLYSGGGFFRGLTPGADGVIVRAPVGDANSYEGAPDLSTGGVWTMDEAGLVHRASDGALLRRVTRVRPEGGTAEDDTPFKLKGAFRVAPDGAVAWQLTELIDGLERIELGVEPPLVRTLDVSGYNLRPYGIFEPSAPIPGQGLFVWMTDGAAIVTVDTGGNVTPRFTLPAAEAENVEYPEYAPIGAVSTMSNRLCLATTVLDSANGPVAMRLRWIEPDAGETDPGVDLATIDVTGIGFFYPGDVVVGTDGVDETCWLVISDEAAVCPDATGNHILVEGWSDDGAVARGSIDDRRLARSVVASPSPHRLYVTAQVCGDVTTEILDFDEANPFSFEQIGLETGPIEFITP